MSKLLRALCLILLGVFSWQGLRAQSGGFYIYDLFENITKSDAIISGNVLRTWDSVIAGKQSHMLELSVQQQLKGKHTGGNIILRTGYSTFKNIQKNEMLIVFLHPAAAQRPGRAFLANTVQGAAANTLKPANDIEAEFYLQNIQQVAAAQQETDKGKGRQALLEWLAGAVQHTELRGAALKALAGCSNAGPVYWLSDARHQETEKAAYIKYALSHSFACDASQELTAAQVQKIEDFLYSTEQPLGSSEKLQLTALILDKADKEKLKDYLVQSVMSSTASSVSAGMEMLAQITKDETLLGLLWEYSQAERKYHNAAFAQVGNDNATAAYEAKMADLKSLIHERVRQL